MKYKTPFQGFSSRQARNESDAWAALYRATGGHKVMADYLAQIEAFRAMDYMAIDMNAVVDDNSSVMEVYRSMVASVTEFGLGSLHETDLKPNLAPSVSLEELRFQARVNSWDTSQTGGQS